MEGVDLPGHERLWRRFNPEDLVTQPDGTRRPASSIFNSSESNGISVHRASLISIDAIIHRYPGAGVAEISVGDVVAERTPEVTYRVIAAPIQDQPGIADDPSHALIVPAITSKGIARRLVKKCRIVYEP